MEQKVKANPLQACVDKIVASTELKIKDRGSDTWPTEMLLRFLVCAVIRGEIRELSRASTGDWFYLSATDWDFYRESLPEGAINSTISVLIDLSDRWINDMAYHISEILALPTTDDLWSLLKKLVQSNTDAKLLGEIETYVCAVEKQRKASRIKQVDPAITTEFQ